MDKINDTLLHLQEMELEQKKVKLRQLKLQLEECDAELCLLQDKKRSKASAAPKSQKNVLRKKKKRDGFLRTVLKTPFKVLKSFGNGLF